MILLIVFVIVISGYILYKKKNKYSKKYLITISVILFALFCLRIGLTPLAIFSFLYLIFSPFLYKLFGYNEDNNAQNANIKIMTIGEAAEILELPQNATKEEIKKSYHKLMQKVHPDIGGSKYFANKLTEAYKTLINKHN